MSEEQELLAAIRETNDLLRRMLARQEQSKIRMNDLLERQQAHLSPVTDFRQHLAEMEAKRSSFSEKMDERRAKQELFQETFLEQLKAQTEALCLIASKLGVSLP